MSEPLKIELPGGLRRLVEDKRAELLSALEREPSQRAGLECEISKLETIVRQLEGEITGLKIEAITSEDSALVLNTKETRLREATARLNNLRMDLQNLRPLTMDGCRELLQAVVRFYNERLPGKIMILLSPVCRDYATSLRVASQCDSVTILRGLSGWSSGLDFEPATPSNVDRICSVFDRALRGQLHLGADIPAPAADSETANAPAAGPAGETDGESTRDPAEQPAPALETAGLVDKSPA